MIIDNQTVVSLHYRLQEGNAEGEFVEETFGSEPLVFLYGSGAMIPEFERQLSGMKAGDEFAFSISSADAYGEYDEDAIVPLPIDVFMEDGELMSDVLQLGAVLPMHDEDGNSLLGTVLAINEADIVMDFNHPMAGQDLYFKGVVNSVRAATPEESEHGHVHGEGGIEH